MANTAFVEMIPMITRSLSSDPTEPVLVSLIRETLADICRNTDLWLYSPDPVELYSGESSYPIEHPYGSKVHRVMWVKLNGWLLKQRPLAPLSECYGNPTAFCVTELERLQFYPVLIESLPESLTYEVSLIPAPDAEDAPEALMERASDALLHGVLSRCYGMSGQTFADMNLMAFHQNEYRQAIAALHHNAHQNFGRRVVRTTPVH